MGVNKVILLGSLTRDTDVRKISGGLSVARLALTTTTEVSRDPAGHRRVATEHHQVVVQGRQADVLVDSLTFGQTVYVEGRLQTRQWNDHGTVKYLTEIRADVIQVIGMDRARDDDRRDSEASRTARQAGRMGRAESSDGGS